MHPSTETELLRLLTCIGKQLEVANNTPERKLCAIAKLVVQHEDDEDFDGLLAFFDEVKKVING